MSLGWEGPHGHYHVTQHTVFVARLVVIVIVSIIIF